MLFLLNIFKYLGISKQNLNILVFINWQKNTKTFKKINLLKVEKISKVKKI